MAATASSMIINSLISLGDKIIGDTLTSAEQTYYLAKLNTFLESCDLDRLLVYQIVEESFTLVIGSSSYTIGSGGNFNTARPTKVEDTCFINYLNTLYFVEVLSERNFTGLQTQGLSGMPRNLYYNLAAPLGTITFDYLPDIAYDFHLKSWKQRVSPRLAILFLCRSAISASSNLTSRSKLRRDMSAPRRNLRGWRGNRRPRSAL